MISKVLTKIGLTDNETKVYLAFHANPKTSAAQISRRLGMDKSSAYKAVETLLEKGLLIREGWDKAFVYSASNPDSLKDLMRTKEIEINNDKNMLEEFIIRLKRDKPEDRHTHITIERGIDAVILRITESVENNKEKLIREKFHHHKIFNDDRYVKFVMESAKDRSKRKVYIKQLEMDSDVKARKGMFPGLMTDLVKYYKDVRMLPKSYTDQNSLRIWDDTAMILSYDDSGEFIVLTIKDKYIVTLLKSFFDFLWDSSTPIIRNYTLNKE